MTEGAGRPDRVGPARLVLDDRVVVGTVSIEADRIAGVEIDEDADAERTRSSPGSDRTDRSAELPYLVPGFVDLHVHGWGGHDAMGDRAALDGMARSLLSRGVTSFLPTAVTAPLADLAAFAVRVREWASHAPDDGAEPLGFNLEGPFLARGRRGAHEPAFLRMPADASDETIEEMVDGLRLITIAPELPGALRLIGRLAERGVAVSLGHSDATVAEARAGYDAGARSTTHLFNAMSGVTHRSPGLAVAALTDDAVWTELIADGHHVDRALWPIVTRTKPPDRLVLVSDALPIAGTNLGRGRIGGLDVEVDDGRAVVAGTSTLAGSVIALDTAVRNLVGTGVPIAAAVAAATTNPLGLVGVRDRGRIARHQRADLVELSPDLAVTRVMRGGRWVFGPAS